MLLSSASRPTTGLLISPKNLGCHVAIGSAAGVNVELLALFHALHVNLAPCMTFVSVEEGRRFVLVPFGRTMLRWIHVIVNANKPIKHDCHKTVAASLTLERAQPCLLQGRL